MQPETHCYDTHSFGDWNPYTPYQSQYNSGGTHAPSGVINIIIITVHSKYSFGN